MSREKALRNLSKRGWVSLQELADLAGCTVGVIYNLRDKGEINPVKIGSQYRVYKREVRDVLRKRLSPEDLRVITGYGGLPTKG